MKLLFYYPSNKSSVAIESLLIALKKRGYDVTFLSMGHYGDLHRKLENHGIYVSCASKRNTSGLFFYLAQLLFLVSFCRKNKISHVLSNLQQANIVSVLAQFFVNSKFIIFRHHFQFTSSITKIKKNRNEQLGDLLVNLLAKKIVVPSRAVFEGMVKVEGVRQSKVQVIPYLYNFEFYNNPSLRAAEKIRNKYKCEMLIIMVARLHPLKRHSLAIKVFHQLRCDGLDVKMIILDDGPEKDNLQKLICDLGLEDFVFFLGFRRDFINYMEASDVLLHPSLSEASNSVVKEMGVLKKPVIVSQGVGDFSDYIVNEHNGFLVHQENPSNQIYETLIKLYNNPPLRYILGENLKSTVLQRFSVNENTIGRYLKLLHS